MKSKILSIFVLCALVAGCRGRSAVNDGPSVESGNSFPMVEVPGVMSEPQDRVDYLTEHFWDRFADAKGTTDSLTIKGIPQKEVEEKFVLWVTVLKAASAPVMEKAVAGTVSAARAEASATRDYAVLNKLTELACRHLYDPNSPGRNEEAYLVFLSALLSGPLPDESSRSIYEFQAKLCSLNRPGTPAADFKFITPEGRISSLYSVEAPVTLLIFSNPGCPLCATYQDNLRKSEPLSDKLHKGAFKIVNIYPDEDVQAWEEYVRTYPPEWICGRDHLGQLFSNTIYSLRAIPSLYLLDADKNVILKDATYEEVEMKLYDLLF
ncbi:MAG: DUF5106 domain-containing protein [Bacteroidales bacterium]|nr:DUF5106 domain-containing protein [Bacteroidales bacterium]